MLPIQRWMYRTLCQAAFVESTRPYLPDDDSQLWKLAGCESLKQWKQYKAEVRAAFSPVVIDGKNLLSRERIVKDWEHLEERRESLQERGRKGGKAKKSKSPEESKEVKGSEIEESKKRESKVSNTAKQLPSSSQAIAKQELKSSPSPSENPNSHDLTDVVKQLALKVSKNALFNRKSTAAITAAIQQAEATETELRKVIPSLVETIANGKDGDEDTFALKNVGTLIAEGLAALISIVREEESEQLAEEKLKKAYEERSRKRSEQIAADCARDAEKKEAEQKGQQGHLATCGLFGECHCPIQETRKEVAV